MKFIFHSVIPLDIFINLWGLKEDYVEKRFSLYYEEGKK